jgi:anti-sigma regulatory factor (Ser/Thr protein kinase)
MADIWSRGNVPRWAASADEAGQLVLDQAFDVDRLHELRNAVLAAAVAAGMPDDQAAQVMLAVHELAANAVLHGGGAGRARLRVVGAELHCRVSDVGQRAADGQLGADGQAHGDGADATTLWQVLPGHGLWLVRNIADHLSMTSSLGGSQVHAVFALPEFRGGATGQ